MGSHHGHHHHHDHGSGRRSEKSLFRLKIALVLTTVYMFAEAIGGWWTNSLALIADAGHMLTDVAALLLTLVAINLAARPATPKKTYGHYRLEILAAFINGIALVLISLWILYEAYHRWSDPAEVLGLQMTLIAVGGLVINIIAATLLHSDQKHDLNLRGAWLHIMGDMLGSVAAMIAGLLILAFGWFWADIVTSVIISIIIMFASWNLILESVNVLLEGTPKHLDIAAIERTIVETEGVEGVHDLHVWTISSGIIALSAHITHDDTVPQSQLLTTVREKLHNTYSIDHLTIQMEPLNSEGTENVYTCDTGANCFVSPINEVGNQH